MMTPTNITVTTTSMLEDDNENDDLTFDDDVSTLANSTVVEATSDDGTLRCRHHPHVIIFKIRDGTVIRNADCPVCNMELQPIIQSLKQQLKKKDRELEHFELSSLRTKLDELEKENTRLKTLLASPASTSTSTTEASKESDSMKSGEAGVTNAVQRPQTVFISPRQEIHHQFPHNDHANAHVDHASLSPTVASSTYGDERRNVRCCHLDDQSGNRGLYSGDVLVSTNMPHGSGTMKYDHRCRYDGEWRHGRWHGFATYRSAAGDTYEGQYQFDQRHGRGKYRWSDGRVYEGGFQNDKRHGKGTFTWPDGDKYIGDFKNGQREGRGRFIFSQGGYYKGCWIDGRYHGWGELHREDGSTYKGEWQGGMPHGIGVETNTDGSIGHDGLWIEAWPITDT